MKNKTQWDLSGGETTIDLFALKAVLVSAAVSYADAIQAYFHICEAIKREEIKIYRGGLTLNKWQMERIAGE